MKNKIEKNKGITLIALVITIIVLLILAGIAISAISGQNSILKQAGNAKDKTVEGTEKEQLALALINAKAEAALNNRTELTKEDVAESLKKIYGEENIKENENLIGNGPWTYIKEDERYVIDKKGNVTNKSADEDIKFYIYHSSDNTVETATVKQGETFNIYNKTKSGYYYAGYYSNYAGKGSYAGDGVEAKDGTEITYSGENIANVKWIEAEAYTEKGTEMHPQDEQTHYLKEVDQNFYLKLSGRSGDKGGKMATLHFFSAIDDGVYQEVGFYLNTDGNRLDNTKLYTDFTLNIAGNKIKHTANERFNAPKGYLVYNRASSLIKEDTNISVTAFFKTIDGIEEKGIWTYEIEFNKLYVNGEDRYIIELVRNR